MTSSFEPEFVRRSSGGDEGAGVVGEGGEEVGDDEFIS